MTIPSLRVVDARSSRWTRRPVGHEPRPLPPGGTGPPHRSRRTLARLLLASDVGATVVAALLTALLTELSPPLAASTGSAPARLAFLPVAVAVTVGVLALRGTYAGARRRLAPGVADELLSLVGGIAIAGLVLLVAATGPLHGWLPPTGVAAVVGMSLVLIPSFRSLALVLAAKDPARISRVIVVGSGRVAGELAHRLDRSPLVEVVGTVDDDPAGSLDVLGAVDDLPGLCRALRADRVVIAFSRRHPSRSAELVLALRDVVEVDVVVRYFELAGWESRLHDVNGLSLLNLGSPPGKAAEAAKRLIDVTVAALALLVLAPAMVLIALAVRAQSGSPVFFRQTRVGRDRRTFTILKFRTMTTPTAAQTAPSVAGNGTRATGAPVPVVGSRTLLDGPDPSRVTRIGRLLRRTSLDELPQLLNVLWGQMSLVGPRPFVPDECTALVGWSLRRFDVRPGITGMWQVCGQHDVSIDELARLDVQYATSWSIRTDLRILARTPTRLLHGSAPNR